MDCVSLQHLRGSRQSACDTFALDTGTSLLLGRDPAADVSFDPVVDDLVGRQHARISRDAHHALDYRLHDLGARNGTFVNRRRVIGDVPLRSGDVIQLGAGGPELLFQVTAQQSDTA